MLISKNKKKMGKKALCLIFAFLLSINSMAAVVADNDGSAFITKAEFDSLKNSFQSQLDSYNTGIDNKIDNAIASYLAGSKIESQVEQDILINRTSNNFFMQNPILETNEVRHFDINGESTFIKFNGGSIMVRLRRIMNDTTKANFTYETSGTWYGGVKGKYFLWAHNDYGSEPIEYWTNFYIIHNFAGAASYGGGADANEKPNGDAIWTPYVVFSNFSKYDTTNVTWGPRIPQTNITDPDNPMYMQNWNKTVHVSSIYKSHDTQKLKFGFTNKNNQTTSYGIWDDEKDYVLHMVYAKTDTSNSTWGWVLNCYGDGTEHVKKPTMNDLKYDIKKPKSFEYSPMNFVSTDLSKYLEKSIRFTDGMPIVKCTDDGTLSFKLSMTSDKPGLVTKFGFKAKTRFDNNDTISNYVTSCNLTDEDFNYNCDTHKELSVKMTVEKGDIIYMKVDTANLKVGDVYYKVIPQITNMYIQKNDI